MLAPGVFGYTREKLFNRLLRRHLRYRSWPGKQPSHPHIASCRQRLWLHMDHAAFEKEPSSVLRELFRLDLNDTRTVKIGMMQLRKECDIPKAMPGFSVRTFSRCSLAKNI